jgi:hypothetical protein
MKDVTVTLMFISDRRDRNTYTLASSGEASLKVIWKTEKNMEYNIKMYLMEHCEYELWMQLAYDYTQ